MLCPICQGEEIKIVDVRKKENHYFRRRECQECLSRFNTKEWIDIKSLKELNPYAMERLLHGEKI